MQFGCANIYDKNLSARTEENQSSTEDDKHNNFERKVSKKSHTCGQKRERINKTKHT